MQNLNSEFSIALPLEIIPSAGAGKDKFRAVPLITTGKASWGESNITDKKAIGYQEGADAKGPLTLAAAVSPAPTPRRTPYGPPPVDEKKSGARLVIFGDVDFIANRLIEATSGNRALIMSAVNWVARKASKLGIPPKMPDNRRVTVNAQAEKAVFAIVLIAMPLCCILLGGVVWWFRRR